MTKATKATIKRLETEDFGSRTRIATLLETVVKSVNYAEKQGEPNGIFNSSYVDNGLFFMAEGSDKNILAGLYTKFPSLIECTFTAGNSQVIIPDINKLVKALLKEQSEE